MTITRIDQFHIKTNNININTISNDLIGCVVGWDEISIVEPNPNSVLISITEPGSSYISKDIQDLYEKVLNIQFWDVTDEQCEKFTLEKYPAINKDQAQQIYDFILNNRTSQFVVHCAAGISRSAGVAQSIMCLLECEGDVYTFQTAYKDPIKEHWRYSPNKTVFDRIIGRQPLKSIEWKIS